MNSISKLRIKYVVLFILILICAFSIGLTNSRYTSDSNYEDNLAIAKPVVEIESQSETEISNMLPGDTVEYLFNIKNTDGTNQNEVLLNYYLKVTFASDALPLTYEIFDITDGTETKLELSSNQTNLISLGFTNIETHKYKIKLTWPEDQNDVSLANQNVAFDIDVYAEQVVD